MPTYIRFGTVPTVVLEELLRENERDSVRLEKERRRAITARKMHNSAGDFFQDRYGSLCWNPMPDSALVLGTSVRDQGVVVKGVPFKLSQSEVVLQPYANRVVVMFEDPRRPDIAVYVGEAKDGRVDSLSLQEQVPQEEQWIASKLIVPFSQIYMHALEPVKLAVAREVHPQYRTWASAAGRTA